MDKENVKRISRLPVPQAPLPALPHHLLNKLRNRPPLNTLAGPNGHNVEVPTGLASNSQGFAGASNSRRQCLIASHIIIDTNLVTMRRGGCGYFVPFEDKKRKCSQPSIICISSDEEHDSNTTPHSLQPAKVKSVKRSLKRPHSRELQGSTPLGNLEISDDSAKRRLSFDEILEEQMRSPNFVLNPGVTDPEVEYLSDILWHLLEVETKPVSLPRVESNERASAIDWLMKMNAENGNPATIQTAVWYLDAVLASGDVILEKMKLIAAACYWIAAKIHGLRPPASRLVEFANNVFTAQSLSQAEAVIMDQLKFPRQPVIPQEYLYYFAWWCSKEQPDEIEVAATFICLCGMMVNKKLCDEYPSMVAATSIINALLLLRKTALLPRLRECPVYVAAVIKSRKLSRTCVTLRNAVRKVASKKYRYNFIYKQYGAPPKHIAQTVATEAYNLFEVADTDILNKKIYIPSKHN